MRTLAIIIGAIAIITGTAATVATYQPDADTKTTQVYQEENRRTPQNINRSKGNSDENKKEETTTETTTVQPSKKKNNKVTTTREYYETTTAAPVETTTTQIYTTQNETTTYEQSTKWETTTKAKTNGYTENDLYILACVICQEAGGEPESTRLMVGNVFLNRVESPKSDIPDTFYGVATQRNAYGNMCRNGVKFPSWADNDAISKSYDSARKLLYDGVRVLPNNVLYQSEHNNLGAIYKAVPATSGEFPYIYFMFG